MRPRILLLGALLIVGGAVASFGQSTGYVRARAIPGRAGVFVDGKYMGPVANFNHSRKYKVPAGEHEVKLVDPRYEEYVTNVDVTAGRTTVVSQVLKRVPVAQPPFGVLRIKHQEKFAAVYLNGKFYGHADEFNNFKQGLLLNPGEYTLRIEPVSGSNAVEKTITMQANETTIVE
jgi:hypothetical protein